VAWRSRRRRLDSITISDITDQYSLFGVMLVHAYTELINTGITSGSLRAWK
jgi:hypothetical protein